MARTPTTGSALEVFTQDGRHVIEHSGEVGGFVAENILFPDDHAAIAVLTNQEASNAASQIAKQIAALILPAKAAPTPAPSVAKAFAPHLQTILAGLQKGDIDRALFTADCNDYFDRTALADYQSSLAPLGTITSVTVGARLPPRRHDLQPLPRRLLRRHHAHRHRLPGARRQDRAALGRGEALDRRWAEFGAYPASEGSSRLLLHARPNVRGAPPGVRRHHRLTNAAPPPPPRVATATSRNSASAEIPRPPPPPPCPPPPPPNSSSAAHPRPWCLRRSLR